MSFCHLSVSVAVILSVADAADVDNHARHIATFQGENALPRLEVSLDPPAQPFPEATRTIGALDATREHEEESNRDRLLDAFRRARESAKQRIAFAIGDMMRNFNDQLSIRPVAKNGLDDRHGVGFLSLGRNTKPTFSFRVGTAEKKNSDPNVNLELRALESQREDWENRSVDHAINAFNAITDDVVNELEAQMRQQLEHPSATHGGASFGGVDGKITQQAIVKVVPASAFPTISSLVDDMETRRNVMEDLSRAHVLDLQLQLVKDENAMIKEALEAGVERILRKGQLVQ